MKGQVVMLQRQLRSDGVCSQGSRPETVLPALSLDLAFSPAFHPYWGLQPPSLCLVCTGAAGSSRQEDDRPCTPVPPARPGPGQSGSRPLSAWWTPSQSRWAATGFLLTASEPSRGAGWPESGPCCVSGIPENAHAKVPSLARGLSRCPALPGGLPA